MIDREVGVSSGGCGGRGLVFELVGAALVGEDVVARTDIHRLIDRSAFTKCVKKLHFYYFTRCRNHMVWRDGDVASGNQLVVIIESDGHAAFGIATRDDK